MLDKNTLEYLRGLQIYPEQLKESAKKTNSIVCMGLDFVRSALPFNLRNESAGFYMFAQEIFETMQARHIQCAAFKPNQGFYAIDKSNGYKNLEDILAYLSHHFFETPVILDYKRGDIGPSSENYAQEAFTFGHGFHAITVSPYMGTDSVEPFLKCCTPLTEEDIQKGEDHIRSITFNKGVYILNRTSNKGAVDFQNLKLEDGRFVYEAVADKIIEWSKKYPGTGAVVGATSLEELRRLAERYAPHNIPLLIPGVGKQGGSAKEVVAVLREARYPLYLARINASSGITHPWVSRKEEVPGNYANICTNELQKLNEEIGPIF
jgi:orotidine-5'-phosphate decarboxylase